MSANTNVSIHCRWLLVLQGECVYACMYVCMYVWVDGWEEGWRDGWRAVCLAAALRSTPLRPIWVGGCDILICTNVTKHITLTLIRKAQLQKSTALKVGCYITFKPPHDHAIINAVSTNHRVATAVSTNHRESSKHSLNQSQSRP